MKYGRKTRAVSQRRSSDFHRVGVVARGTNTGSRKALSSSILRGMSTYKNNGLDSDHTNPRPSKNNRCMKPGSGLASRLKRTPQPLFTVSDLQQLQRKYYKSAQEELEKYLRRMYEHHT
jgi:hypothetical protein